MHGEEEVEESDTLVLPEGGAAHLEAIPRHEPRHIVIEVALVPLVHLCSNTPNSGTVKERSQAGDGHKKNIQMRERERERELEHFISQGL